MQHGTLSTGYGPSSIKDEVLRGTTDVGEGERIEGDELHNFKKENRVGPHKEQPFECRQG